MGSKVVPATKIKSGKQVTSLLTSNGISVRPGKGSHRIGDLPNGQKLTYYEHGEFPTGTRCTIIKILKAIGLVFVLTTGVYLHSLLF
jgi:predicted RNA binding protein YcfA (HicA-like mRNA interferase family)